MKPPHCAEGSWKSSFISAVRPGSTLIHPLRVGLQKRYSKLKNLKTPAFRFRVDGKHFENGVLRKGLDHENHVISLTELSSNQIINDL